MNLTSSIWIFHGAKAQFSSAAFTSKEKADEWILKHSLTGMLTKYPLDIGVYDWALEEGFFKPKKEEQLTKEFIQKFTTASMEHYHYENGICLNE